MKGARTVRRGGNGDLTQDKQDIFAIYLERPHVPYPTVWEKIRKSVTSQTGGAVANLQVATSESWRDKQTGEIREQTEWHRVVLFGKLAEVAGEYLRKGAQVYIEGQLRTRSWEDNGITRYVTEILVKTTGTMQMLGRAAGTQTQPEEAQQFSGQPQPESQPEPKKGGAKTKGRGRKAAQPEPQQPSEPAYDFDDDIPF